jgi:hypothetical protein
MTNLQVFRLIRSYEMAVSLNDGEWRVDYRRGDSRKTPNSSYFTTDKQDAIDTAIVMAQWAPEVK